MQLEIVIKVPLAGEGLSGVGLSLEPQAAATASGTNGSNAADGRAAPELTGASIGIAHEPPSLSELGIGPEPMAIDPGPPAIEQIERMAATGTAQSPPGLEGLPLEEILRMSDEAAAPPDLPDPSTFQPEVAEFAPPPLDEFGYASARDAGGRANARAAGKNGKSSRK